MVILFPDANTDIQNDDDDEGDESRVGVHEEHDDDTEDGPNQ